MEVHAHTHTARKRWAHFLWDFLMLFLAVFCGFLAENQREHLVEHRRVKQYSKSLVRDLEQDTAMLSIIVTQIDTIMNTIERFSTYAKNKDLNQIGNIELYKFFLNMGLYRPYAWNRATLEQIKNSGSLRYFSNDSIVNRISSYDAFTRHLDQDFGGDEIRAEKLASRRNQLVDLNYPEELINGLENNWDSTLATGYYKEITKNDLSILTKDVLELKRLVNDAITIGENLWARQEVELPKARQDAIVLITMLKKEYHLD
ncbi:MAG TPA: hypothetical protein VLJ68_12770 [Chitinophagaceae bacterium]|nr:hypothetical protein [Chitinophagaceae bacterium]